MNVQDLLDDPWPEPRHVLPPRPLAVSMEHASEAIGVGRTTLYRLVREGKLPSVQVYGRRLVRISDLEAFLDALAAGHQATGE